MPRKLLTCCEGVTFARSLSCRVGAQQFVAQVEFSAAAWPHGNSTAPHHSPGAANIAFRRGSGHSVPHLF